MGSSDCPFPSESTNQHIYSVGGKPPPAGRTQCHQLLTDTYSGTQALACADNKDDCNTCYRSL